MLLDTFITAAEASLNEEEDQQRPELGNSQEGAEMDVDGRKSPDDPNSTSQTPVRSQPAKPPPASRQEGSPTPPLSATRKPQPQVNQTQSLPMRPLSPSPDHPRPPPNVDPKKTKDWRNGDVAVLRLNDERRKVIINKDGTMMDFTTSEVVSDTTGAALIAPSFDISALLESKTTRHWIRRPGQPVQKRNVAAPTGEVDQMDVDDPDRRE